VWGSPSTDKIHSVEEWFTLLGYDAESTIPEEDLNSIQQLLHTPVSNADALMILSDISVLSLSDLKNISSSKDIESLKSNDELSTAVRFLINSINIINYAPLKVLIKEKISFQNGVRHDWRAIGSLENFEYGILLEKDPGEQNISDHNSIYLKWNSTKMNLIAGDHQLVGGYGLISWRTSSAHKGFATLNSLLRQGKGITGYRSSNEYWSTRGLGGDWQTDYGKFTFSLGRTYQDGSLNENEIKLDKTGIHVTPSDLFIQNQLLEYSATVMWNNNFHSNHLGLIINSQNVIDNTGENIQRQSVSIFTSGNWNEWYWFGESALNTNKKVAFLGGVMFKNKLLKYLLSIRHYPAYFRTYRTQPFAEWQGQNDGEKGIFQNVQLKYGKHVIFLYTDMVEKIVDNFFLTNNNIKYESGVRWQWRYNKHLIHAQLRKSNQLNTTQMYFPNNIDYDISRTTTKGSYQYKATKYFDIRWQVNSTSYNDESKGVGFETQFNWKIQQFAIRGSWIAAQIDDFNGRVYFWDLNLPGEMRSVAISQNKQILGFRVQMKPNNNYRLYMRWRSSWNSIRFSGTAMQSYALAIQINF